MIRINRTSENEIDRPICQPRVAGQRATTSAGSVRNRLSIFRTSSSTLSRPWGAAMPARLFARNTVKIGTSRTRNHCPGRISRRSRSHWKQSQNSARDTGLSTYEAKVERAVPCALLRFRRRSRNYLASSGGWSDWSDPLRDKRSADTEK